MYFIYPCAHNFNQSCSKRQPRFDEIFNSDKPLDGPHYKKKAPETKPYDYGMIGQQATNPINITPPSSPPPMQSSLGMQSGQSAGLHSGSQGIGHGTGLDGGQSLGNGQGVSNTGSAGQGFGGQTSGLGQGIGPGHTAAPQPPVHLRNPSLTPLLAGVAVAAGAAGANAAVAGSSRPSTASSMEPLVMHASSHGGGSFPPTSASSSSSMYPPALQSWTAAQGFTPQSSASNVQGYGVGPSMNHGSAVAGPSSLTHNTSAGSYGSSSWSAPSTSSMGISPMAPVVVGGARNSTQQQSFAQYDDPFARSGSPVSVQEQRILQVTNADPATPVYPPIGPSRQSYLGGSAGPSAIGIGRQTVDRTAGTQGVDGKGRPLNVVGEKVPLVHLDGELYQEPAPDAPAPAPPAYET